MGEKDTNIMRLCLLLAIAVAVVAGSSIPGLSAPIPFRSFDPHPDWGGQNKLFYEGWGFGAPAGEYSLVGSLPYRVEDPYGAPPYGRGWTSIGVNKEAWVVSGENYNTNPKPKPPYYHLAGAAGYIHESNDWTNTDTDGGSRAFAGPTYPYSTGTYVDGPQAYYNQAVWLDANDLPDPLDPDPESAPRSQILLKHDVPSLPDPKKVRADTLYFFLKNANQEMGYGIRMYFEPTGGGEAYADFALHFYKSEGGYNNISTFGWRVVGIPEHPEWADWTDTPAQMHTVVNEHTWKQVAIDCGQILPGGLTFITRGSIRGATYGWEMGPEGPGMMAAWLPNFTQYINRVTAIAVGQVDDTVAVNDVGEQLWLDDVWISTGITDPIDSVLSAKTSATAKRVLISDATVTAVFYEGSYPTYKRAGFAIEEPDRNVGIRVTSSDETVQVGDRVGILGGIATIAGERIITAQLVTVQSSGNTPPEPVFTSNRASGGGVLGAQQAVVNDAVAPTYAVGLSNVGILQRIYGTVTASNDNGDYTGYFYVDDGSRLFDGSFDPVSAEPNVGIRCRPLEDPVYTPYPASLPVVGERVVVEGVMGVQQINGINARLMWTTKVETL